MYIYLYYKWLITQVSETWFMVVIYKIVKLNENSNTKSRYKNVCVCVYSFPYTFAIKYRYIFLGRSCIVKNRYKSIWGIYVYYNENNMHVPPPYIQNKKLRNMLSEERFKPEVQHLHNNRLIYWMSQTFFSTNVLV